VIRNEPLRRSRVGKPHMAEFCWRTGGEDVYVRGSQILTPGEYDALVKKNPRGHWGFTLQKRNMTVYVRGRIKHDDHKTLVLNDWHQVLMNTENQSQAMRFVTFID
jgi:hypothetical protein